MVAMYWRSNSARLLLLRGVERRGERQAVGGDEGVPLFLHCRVIGHHLLAELLDGGIDALLQRQIA
jgi:hypothetical protein